MVPRSLKAILGNRAGAAVRALVSSSADYQRLKYWVHQTRPLHVLGMLQYASAFNANWTEDIGVFDLLLLLSRKAAGLTWKTVCCNSLAEGYTTLRSLMGITHDARLPRANQNDVRFSPDLLADILQMILCRRAMAVSIRAVWNLPQYNLNSVPPVADC
jgi:hypothetical protein